MTDIELCKMLSGIAPFSQLSETELTSILSSSDRRQVQAKQTVFIEGEDAEAGWVVLKGRIAMIKSSLNGRELITELLPEGELFGIISFIDSKPYPLTARAQCDGLVLRIPRRTMLPILQARPEYIRAFISIISGRTRSAQNLARAVAHDKVESRISSILLAMIPRFATESKGAPVELFLGRQELADSAGTTIETASRVIKAFEKEGFVDAGRVGLLLLKDIPKLAVIAEGRLD